MPQISQCCDAMIYNSYTIKLYYIPTWCKSYHSEWACKFLLSTERTSLVNLRASKRGSKSNSAVSCGSENQDFIGIALSAVRETHKPVESIAWIDLQEDYSACNTISLSHPCHEGLPGFPLYAAGELSTMKMLERS